MRMGWRMEKHSLCRRRLMENRLMQNMLMQNRLLEHRLLMHRLLVHRLSKLMERHSFCSMLVHCIVTLLERIQTKIE